MPKRKSACQRIWGRFTALTDYEVETARDALEVLFRLEEGFGARPEADAAGARPEADAAGARVVVDPDARGAGLRGDLREGVPRLETRV